MNIVSGLLDMKIHSSVASRAANVLGHMTDILHLLVLAIAISFLFLAFLHTVCTFSVFLSFARHSLTEQSVEALRRCHTRSKPGLLLCTHVLYSFSIHGPGYFCKAALVYTNTSSIDYGRLPMCSIYWARLCDSCMYGHTSPTPSPSVSIWSLLLIILQLSYT